MGRVKTKTCALPQSTPGEFGGHLLCHHLQGFRIQSIEALARILEIEALLKDMLLLQPAQGISHGSRRKIGFGNYIFLREEYA